MYFCFEVGSDLCENAKSVPRLAPPKSGDYPRIFGTYRNTELLVTLAVNEPMSLSRLRLLLNLDRMQAQDHLDQLVRGGIVFRFPIRIQSSGRARIVKLLAVDRGHSAYRQTASLLLCLAKRFKAPRGHRDEAKPSIPHRAANGVDPSRMLGRKDQRESLILIALLGQANNESLRSVLAKKSVNMSEIVAWLVKSGLVSQKRVGNYSMLRIGLTLPCRSRFVALLKKIGGLDETYLGLARNAHRALPKLKKRRQKAKRRGHVP